MLRNKRCIGGSAATLEMAHSRMQADNNTRNKHVKLKNMKEKLEEFNIMIETITENKRFNLDINKCS